MSSWYYDKRAGLIREEGKEGYVCRGIRKGFGHLLAAAPDMFEALMEITPYMEWYFPDVKEFKLVKKAIAKAEGRNA
ncbi:hypothetical protein [Gelria sp. Kuro-4]|uniref:hypothetical protein n=1 Tax=Gelria sp. Kuro-4 TaxID=2796927 RepID=UPI001BEE0FDC|nr:hypothetical protein [Gelria sp. Kuro-4]BCV23252.1 hypothetical protein kuro4_00250 [Gelria sp. Kuro-4]